MAWILLLIVTVIVFIWEGYILVTGRDVEGSLPAPMISIALVLGWIFLLLA